MASRVVLVDDVDDVRLLVRLALARSDAFEVVAEARNGQEALEAAATLEPDLIVLDLGLPDLSATELVRRLRERTTAKIVVFTGADTRVGAGLDVPVEGFARKGGDVRFLVDLLEALDAAGSESAALALQMDTGAGRIARAFVAQQCERWGCGDAVEGAQLIVSELVTNAVLHAHSHPQLVISHHEATVRIEVGDDSPSSPAPRVAQDDDENGRGLMLVAAFSAAWGVEPTASGKRVWAQLWCDPVTADR